jgi:hypothetical protein
VRQLLIRVCFRKSLVADNILLVQTIEIFLTESIDQQNIGIQRIKLFEQILFLMKIDVQQEFEIDEK